MGAAAERSGTAPSGSASPICMSSCVAASPASSAASVRYWSVSTEVRARSGAKPPLMSGARSVTRSHSSVVDTPPSLRATTTYLAGAAVPRGVPYTVPSVASRPRPSGSAAPRAPIAVRLTISKRAPAPPRSETVLLPPGGDSPRKSEGATLAKKPRRGGRRTMLRATVAVDEPAALYARTRKSRSPKHAWAAASGGHAGVPAMVPSVGSKVRPAGSCAASSSHSAASTPALHSTSGSMGTPSTTARARLLKPCRRSGGGPGEGGGGSRNRRGRRSEFSPGSGAARGTRSPAASAHGGAKREPLSARTSSAESAAPGKTASARRMASAGLGGDGLQLPPGHAVLFALSPPAGGKASGGRLRGLESCSAPSTYSRASGGVRTTATWRKASAPAPARLQLAAARGEPPAPVRTSSSDGEAASVVSPTRTAADAAPSAASRSSSSGRSPPPPPPPPPPPSFAHRLTDVAPPRVKGGRRARAALPLRRSPPPGASLAAFSSSHARRSGWQTKKRGASAGSGGGAGPAARAASASLRHRTTPAPAGSAAPAALRLKVGRCRGSAPSQPLTSTRSATRSTVPCRWLSATGAPSSGAQRPFFPKSASTIVTCSAAPPSSAAAEYWRPPM